MKPTEKYEAFELAIALWYWLSHWYDGIRCDKYAAMCQITGKYKLNNIPSIDMDDGYMDEDFTIKSYYQDIDENNWEQTFNDWCDYMDNEWDNN